MKRFKGTSCFTSGVWTGRVGWIEKLSPTALVPFIASTFRKLLIASTRVGRSLVVLGFTGLGAIAGAAGFCSDAQALVINPIFDSTVTSLPNASVVEAAFTSAALFYGNSFSDPVTVNIQVSWGQVQGFALPPGALGASTRYYVIFGTNPNVYPGYGFVRSQLITDATSSIDMTADAFLPAPASVTSSDPQAYQPTTPYLVSIAEARAIGLYPANNSQLDGFVGFGGSSTSDYSFNTIGSIAPGTYDFNAVAEHEIAEVMGRISGIPFGTPVFYTPLDLFRYSANGILNFTASGPAYLSSNGGQNAERGFNNISPGDVSDWITGGPADVSDAFTSAGVRPVFSVADQDALDLIGWNVRGCGGTNPSTCSLLSAGAEFTTSDIPGDSSAISLGQVGITVAYADTALAVPEPISSELFGIGFVVFWLAHRRKGA